jgi:nucleoside-diphosphate-sugar epimerase
MRILVTGATGYIGRAVALTLLKAGHTVLGLARSETATAKLRAAGIGPVAGDFLNPDSLQKAASNVDGVISTASVGSSAGSPESFAQDREAVRALIRALDSSGAPLIFTSGSAVVGIFNNGEPTQQIFDENAVLPLPESVFAPSSAAVPSMIVAGFGAAMAARVGTEQDVIGASGVRGIVVRPGLIYGEGGSYDLPHLINAARGNGGVAPHLGSGNTLHSYVHLDDLANLYQRAIEHAPPGSVLHGVHGEVSQQALAAAVSRMLGAGDRSQSVSLEQMYGLMGPAGISLSASKRMSSQITRRALGWEPKRTDILEDVEFGSYAS